MEKAKSEKKGNYGVPFGKDHTIITKGILIILMIIHHVLASPFPERYQVEMLISDRTLQEEVVLFCKICVSGFAFLSAYGMTVHLKKEKNMGNGSRFRFMCIRLLKLESSVIFIYILAIVYKRFVVVESIRDLYDMGSGWKPVYMLIDALGMAIYFGTPEINVTWWYLHFAVLLIITMPFLYMVYERFRYVILPACLLLPMAVSPWEVRAGGKSDYAMLLPSVLLGIAFAYEEWFEKIKLWNREHRWMKAAKVVGIFMIVRIAFVFWVDVQPSFAYNFVFIIPFAVYEFIAEIPVLNTILKILGKNATNIFLIHTFIYYYWYTDMIYSLKRDWCIILGLLALCMALSEIIELLKKLSGYNRLTEKMLRGLGRYHGI